MLECCEVLWWGPHWIRSGLISYMPVRLRPRLLCGKCNVPLVSPASRIALGLLRPGPPAAQRKHGGGWHGARKSAGDGERDSRLGEPHSSLNDIKALSAIIVASHPPTSNPQRQL